MFKHYSLLYALFSWCGIIFSQSIITLNNDVYIVLNEGTAINPVFIVLDNSNSNAIATEGTGGNIVSENEYNKIRWRINNQTGLYTIPFTTDNDVKIPFSMQITSSGVGGTHVDFSTYPTNPENIIYPSMVSNMADAGTGETDFSYWMMDRFWLIDALNYTALPTSILTFGYDDNELQAPNLALTGNLVASRYNSSSNQWSGTNLNWGSDNTSLDRVENAVVPSNHLYEAWTLIDYITPLPVELIFFNARCEQTFVQLNWATGSELNSLYFEIEKSSDGLNWEIISQIPAQGSINQETNYSYRDYNPTQGTAYYRLIQTDYDGVSESFYIQSVEACGDDNSDIWVYNQLDGHYQLNLQLKSDQQIIVNLYDMNGKQVRQAKKFDAVKGNNVFVFNDNQISTGLYMLVIEGANINYNHKLIIQK